ncbi:zinc finger MYM-type protein 1-like [Helianthus annuus]|uniref:zinc finger MYM-type protein 1-like n=1 Tax=Helianthus annuus TaxID=4232 RepID=UPI000B8FA173|nr:zinc finger MYM-type protein 1-like [Helianthus annuus]
MVNKKEYKGWLEYSSKSDRVFWLCCCLFRGQFGDHRETFVSEGYNNWKKKVHEVLEKYVGIVNSVHNKCFQGCVDLLNENQAVHTRWDKKTPKEKHEYRLRVSASTMLGKRLWNGGLAFHGHDKSKDSLNKGNFLEILELMGEMNEELGKVIFENAPTNNQMTRPKIQADIRHCDAQELMNHVAYPKKYKWRLLFIMLIKLGLLRTFYWACSCQGTIALTLKSAIDDIFARYGLSLKRFRDQGYDGASNMSGEFNGLRALILKENFQAFYIHFFARQLQPVVLAVTHKHTPIWKVFETITSLTNVFCASSKRKDMPRESQKSKLENMENILCTGFGLNHEMTLSRT